MIKQSETEKICGIIKMIRCIKNWLHYYRLAETDWILDEIFLIDVMCNRIVTWINKIILRIAKTKKKSNKSLYCLSSCLNVIFRTPGFGGIVKNGDIYELWWGFFSEIVSSGMRGIRTLNLLGLSMSPQLLQWPCYAWYHG